MQVGIAGSVLGMVLIFGSLGSCSTGQIGKSGGQEQAEPQPMATALESAEEGNRPARQARPQPNALVAGDMSAEQLVAVIQRLGSNINAGNGGIQFSYDEIAMIGLWDEAHDRMRIAAPVTETTELDAEELKVLLEANFHTTLDARYATSNGVLYATFIHPLSSLRETDVQSGIRQVSELVKTYGSTYSSGELTMGDRQQKLPGGSDSSIL